FVRDVLVVPDHLAGLRPDRQHARRVQAVHAAAIGRVVRLGITGAPIDEVELRIVRAVLPGGAAAVFPGVRNVLWPGLGARLAQRRDGVAPPQLLPGFRIPAVEETARGAVAAGHAGDHDAVGHQRRDDADIAFLVVGKFLLPDLLAGLHV